MEREHDAMTGPPGHVAGHDSGTNHDAVSHDKHEGHTPQMFRDRLWVSLLLTVPILYFSEQIQIWFGYEAVDFPGSDWVNPVLATFLYFYAGSVFLKGGYRELKARRPGMMTLISIAISVAYFYSLAVSFGLDGDPFYWELATLLVVMLLGHWIEMRSVQAASTALHDLAGMVPATALRISGDSVEEVDVASLVDGDHILIRPGSQVPADGIVLDGRSTMNEAFLTGESRPVPKGPDDEAVAGGINGEGALTVRVTRTGDATTLSQIMRLVEDAQASRSQYEVLADRAALWLVVVAVGVAVPTFLAWSILGTAGTTYAIARAVTVLVIACPHALGLAIPLVNMNATTIAARNGILVRNREAFERGRNVQFVAFDKTGTLTEGRFVMSEITDLHGDEDASLALAAAVEQSSEHPLADAIVEAARQRHGTISSASSVVAVPGHGLEGVVDGRTIRIGRPEWADEATIPLPDRLMEAIAHADGRGESALVLMVDHEPRAVISVADKIRASARHTVDRLHRLGVAPVMISGDAEATVSTVATELGIERYFSRVLPGDKSRIVRDLKEEGAVAFVGDGINDAPALLEANIGLAIGAGTNVAVESADLVLVDDDPSDVVRVLLLSNATRRKMVQNLIWATGYNVGAIPLAAGVAVSAGIVLSPAIGALLMSVSTVVVAVNAMLLRRVDLGMK